jgi:excinuclease ABC subunit C
MEEVWLSDGSPIILSRTSEGLFLLQRIRDEAHRRAITFHRKRRGSAMTVSALDGVPGLGPTRAKVVLRSFGSVKRLKAASVDEIAQVPGIGRVLAERIKAHLGE